MSNIIWKKERLAYLREIAPGRGNQELADMVNAEFGLTLTRRQISSGKKNHGITSGLTGHFPKGQVPFNKGKKQSEFMSPEGIERTKATRFKKGHSPRNKKPIGSERIDNKDGYTFVKTGKEGYRQKHRVIWEKNNGPVPEEHVIIFLNGNRQDYRIENLAMVSRATHCRINQTGLRSSDPELTKTGIIVGELMSETGRAVRRKKRK